MIHDPPDTDSPVVSFAYLAFVLIVVIIAVGVPFVRAFRKRWRELRLEERKEAVREFCRERGFEPNEADLEAVLRRRR